jgi:RNA polymerase sigma-70 factor (ECF subfamily)
MRALIERHEHAVFALLSRMMIGRGSRAVVEDLAQETFLKMFQALPRFDITGPARFSTWLLTIAARTALDACRRHGRESKRVVSSAHDDDGSGPHARQAAPAVFDIEASIKRREARRRIEHAAATLSDDQRAVLLLAEMHGFSHDEIAGVLEIEVGTVKSRLSRAKERMRHALDEVGHD